MFTSVGVILADSLHSAAFTGGGSHDLLIQHPQKTSGVLICCSHLKHIKVQKCVTKEQQIIWFLNFLCFCFCLTADEHFQQTEGFSFCFNVPISKALKQWSLLVSFFRETKINPEGMKDLSRPLPPDFFNRQKRNKRFVCISLPVAGKTCCSLNNWTWLRQTALF